VTCQKHPLGIVFYVFWGFFNKQLKGYFEKKPVAYFADSAACVTISKIRNINKHTIIPLNGGRTLLASTLEGAFYVSTTIHQCSAVQCSAVQCSAVQCSAVQCSSVKY
jgi:hypothetical protein